MAGASTEESAQTASRWRDCAGELNSRSSTLALRTAGMKDANPVDCTRAIIFKAAPLPCPAPREPSAMSPRRLPARQRDRRPGSLKITASCATTGCGVVTRLAVPPLALGWGKPRANLQAYFTPAVRAAVSKVSVGKIGLCFRLAGKKFPCLSAAWTWC
jgi:hypothetical protein